MENFNDKRSARSFFLKKRRLLTQTEAQTLSARLCENICASEYFRNSDTLLLYSATRGEPDLSMLANVALECGKKVAFPISQTDTCTLDFRTVNSLDELKEGTYKILEPTDNTPHAEISEKTLCIVPALAVDKNGFRLGYGKGYYDRFLRNFTGYSICAISSEHFISDLPKDNNDVPVDAIITETGVIHKK